jgi:hypothetical protein
MLPAVLLKGGDAEGANVSDDLLRAIETFLLARVGTCEEGQCVGCGRVLDGVEHLRIDWASEDGAVQAIFRVCSWECLAAITRPFTAY